jgi:hypothetical protein
MTNKMVTVADNVIGHIDANIANGRLFDTKE